MIKLLFFFAMKHFCRLLSPQFWTYVVLLKTKNLLYHAHSSTLKYYESRYFSRKCQTATHNVTYFDFDENPIVNVDRPSVLRTETPVR